MIQGIEFDWAYVTIICVWLFATIGYAFHDGSDPWVVALIMSIVILCMR